MSTPTAEQLRTARHLGAKATLGHLPEAQLEGLLKVHAKQDRRREKNIADFKAKARGETPIA
jgi:hypothetical protein